MTHGATSTGKFQPLSGHFLCLPESKPKGLDVPVSSCTLWYVQVFRSVIGVHDDYCFPRVSRFLNADNFANHIWDCCARLPWYSGRNTPGTVVGAHEGLVFRHGMWLTLLMYIAHLCRSSSPECEQIYCAD